MVCYAFPRPGRVVVSHCPAAFSLEPGGHTLSVNTPHCSVLPGISSVGGRHCGVLSVYMLHSAPSVPGGHCGVGFDSHILLVGFGEPPDGQAAGTKHTPLRLSKAPPFGHGFPEAARGYSHLSRSLLYEKGGGGGGHIGDV